MLAPSRQLRARLPRQWPRFVKSAVVHTIALAKYVAVHTRSWAGDHRKARVRLAAMVEELEAVVAEQREQIRILNARMERIPPPRRTQYPPAERMAILELRASRG